MTVNEYVKHWCDENYDVRKEDFYVDNAYYIAAREWAISGFKHGLFALVFAAVSFVLCSGNGLTASALSALVNLGILTVCFWFYGIRNYDANSMETSVGFYVLLAILLFVTKSKVPDTVQLLFAILSFALYVYLSFIKPIQFVGIARNMKKRILEEEEEEEKSSKQSYARWAHDFKAYRYGLPEYNAPTDDPVMEEARAMFEGYVENKQMLKARYRQLAKQYHPDYGGDTRLFQCIIEVYDEINKTLVA